MLVVARSQCLLNAPRTLTYFVLPDEKSFSKAGSIHRKGMRYNHKKEEGQTTLERDWWRERPEPQGSCILI